MPNKRPNFQRIIETNDPPKVIEPAKPEEPKPVVEEPYFQKRTVRFETPKSAQERERPLSSGVPTKEKPFYEPSQLFSNPPKTPEEEELIKSDDGYYSLRKNYQVRNLLISIG